MSESCQQRPEQHYDITILSAKCILLSDATVLLTKSVSTFGIQKFVSKVQSYLLTSESCQQSPYWCCSFIKQSPHLISDVGILSAKSRPTFWRRNLVSKVHTYFPVLQSYYQQSPDLPSEVWIVSEKSIPTCIIVYWPHDNEIIAGALLFRSVSLGEMIAIGSKHAKTNQHSYQSEFRKVLWTNMTRLLPTEF